MKKNIVPNVVKDKLQNINDKFKKMDMYEIGTRDLFPYYNSLKIWRYHLSFKNPYFSIDL